MLDYENVILNHLGLVDYDFDTEIAFTAPSTGAKLLPSQPNEPWSLICDDALALGYTRELEIGEHYYWEHEQSDPRQWRRAFDPVNLCYITLAPNQ